MLKNLPKFPSENLLVGFDTSDDACVYKVRDDLAIIQTLDFFPPIVDDPKTYGEIAAANALSDVYAMGGTPTLALNILCFPNCLSMDVLQQILAGGYSKVQEAGAIIAGGHSVEDEEPKYGLAVTGFIHPDEIWTNAGAKEGDVLLLTKPLGSGILNTAAKADMLADAEFAPALRAMATLNKYARDAAITLPGAVHACTDITGFGMLGHTVELAEGSGLTAELYANKLPLLPKALEYAEMGILPAGAYNNRGYVEEKIHFAPAVPLALQDVLFDPQTSGGLLFSVPAARADAMLAALLPACPETAIVGRILPKGEKAVRVV